MEKDPFEDDYQDYLEWSETYEVPNDGQDADFVLILFWWVPVLPILGFAEWMGWLNLPNL